MTSVSGRNKSSGCMLMPISASYLFAILQHEHSAIPLSSPELNSASDKHHIHGQPNQQSSASFKNRILHLFCTIISKSIQLCITQHTRSRSDWLIIIASAHKDYSFCHGVQNMGYHTSGYLASPPRSGFPFSPSDST